MVLCGDVVLFDDVNSGVRAVVAAAIVVDDDDDAAADNGDDDLAVCFHPK